MVSGAWAGELLFSADNTNSGDNYAGDFDLNRDYIASLFEDEYPIQKAYLGPQST